MKVNEDMINSVGLSLVYEPDEPIDPVVDIILIHAIGGHPVRSWKCGGPTKTEVPTPSESTVQLASLRKRLKKNPPVTPLRRSNSEPLLSKDKSTGRKPRSLGRKNSLKSTSRLKLLDFDQPTDKEETAAVYWPLDLLPHSCTKARILTWGYHTIVVDKKPLRLQNDIFSHAKDLVVELAAARTANGVAVRPIIFITHSTGGLLVKEALRLAEAEREGPMKEILCSTTGIVFMACPHRASERSTFGDAIKSMAAVTLQVDPNDQVLQELSGAHTIESELSRHAFVRIWNNYNFKVKTFQESVVLTHRLLEVRAEATGQTARRLASFLGDPRESAETISATHADVCRFGSSDDLGYQSLVSYLRILITREADRGHILTSKETECLAALVRPHHTFSETHPATSYPGTCLWLYDSPDFQSWHHRSGSNKNKILWIKGESGCGKTILLRSLRRRLERQWGPAGSSFIWSTAEGYDTNTIFFPGTRYQQHETNPANVYRTLLAQLFLQDPSLRKALLTLYNHPRDRPETFDDALIVSFFADDYIDQKIETPTRRTFIFVDISDDAGPAYVHELICRLSQLGRNSDFSICVASAHHDRLQDNGGISIIMHLRNSDDILRYVNLNLVAEWEERNQIVTTIGRKAGGVFLWAEIVVNILNAAITEGASQELIEYTLEELPEDLHGLYEWMLSTLNEREKSESLILFQWVILAAEPMRLNDLFVAVRVTEPEPLAAYDDLGPFMALSVGPPTSMRELRQLRNSEITSDTPYQFHQWLRARSIGLLELKTDNRKGVANEPWGLQRVNPIHSSVRPFFLSGRGFACLSGDISPALALRGPSPEDYIDLSHYSLLRACLTYLNMRDFENLGQMHHHHHADQILSSPISPASTQIPPSLTSPASATTTATNLSSISTLVNSPHAPSLLQHSYYLSPTAITPQEHHFRQKTTTSQRNLVMSSYPFLQYAVDHLLFHLLSPHFFRYFLPQHELFLCLSANRFRLWRRWTSLLGLADPTQILQRHGAGVGSVGGGSAAAALLSPVFGAQFRLDRVFRKLARLSVGAGVGVGVGAGSLSPHPAGWIGVVAGLGSPNISGVPAMPKTVRTPRTPRTPVSGKNTFFRQTERNSTAMNTKSVARTTKIPMPTTATAASALRGAFSNSTDEKTSSPIITPSHLRIPPTISLPVPPKTRARQQRGLTTSVGGDEKTVTKGQNTAVYGVSPMALRADFGDTVVKISTGCSTTSTGEEGFGARVRAGSDEITDIRSSGNSGDGGRPSSPVLPPSLEYGKVGEEDLRLPDFVLDLVLDLREYHESGDDVFGFGVAM